MDPNEQSPDAYPPLPNSMALPPGPAVGQTTCPPPKDWPHAPIHRLAENAVYIVTAGTVQKALLFGTPAKLDLMESLLVSSAKRHGWQLEAWAIMANHYHFVARGDVHSLNLRLFIKDLHLASACALNQTDGLPGRNVWFNFWDTRLTHQYSYLARLAYVHRNPVRHGIVPVANQYRWCSARWLERTASPAQVKTIYSFKIDRVHVYDDF